MINGTALRSVAYRSAIVAAAMATPGLANVPAKNLHTMIAAMLFANPVPSTNRQNRGNTMRYTARRPKVSLSGEAISGPSPMPAL